VVSTLRCTIRSQKRYELGNNQTTVQKPFNLLRFSHLCIGFCSKTLVGIAGIPKTNTFVYRISVPSPKLEHWTFSYFRIPYLHFQLDQCRETHLWLSKFCPIPCRAPLFCSRSPLEVDAFRSIPPNCSIFLFRQLHSNVEHFAFQNSTRLLMLANPR